jgi:hypothetical protein
MIQQHPFKGNFVPLFKIKKMNKVAIKLKKREILITGLFKPINEFDI